MSRFYQMLQAQLMLLATVGQMLRTLPHLQRVDAASAALPEAADSDGHESVDSGVRWQLLGKYKTVQALVAAVIQEKSDEQLHQVFIKVILEDIMAQAGGKVSMAELLRKMSSFQLPCSWCRESSLGACFLL